jgi:hypothetical protein
VAIRVFLVGGMHPFFTSFTGIGVAIARLSRNPLVKVLAAPAGYIVAVTAHAFHNTFSGLIGGVGGLLAGTFVDYIGYTFMIGFIIWLIVRERNVLKKQLREEVERGYISQRQYVSALSFFQTSAYLSALTSRTFLKTARFYQVCGELAHKKEQLSTIGDERGNTCMIEQLRSELAALAPAAKT